MIAPSPSRTGLRLRWTGGTPAKLALVIAAILLTCGSGCTLRPWRAGALPNDHLMPHPAGSAEQSMRQGLEAFQRGAFDQAVSNWSDAAKAYATEGAFSKQCETLVRIGRAQQALGLHSKAIQSLEEALAIAQRLGDFRDKATVFGSLGNVYIASGSEEKASKYLNEGLTMSRELNDAALCASILNNLGNLCASRQQYEQAVSFYLESASLSEADGDHLQTGIALGNAAAAASHAGRSEKIGTLLEKARHELHVADRSHEKAVGLISLALTCIRLQERQLSSDGRGDRSYAPGPESTLSSIFLDRRPALSEPARDLLEEALRDAQTLRDPRAASYAWGYLGQMCEWEHDQGGALEFTQNAVLAAQQADAPESLYRWQWQAGRILKAMGNWAEAVKAYRDAAETIQSIRGEMGQCYGHPPVSFREVAGPLYMEFVDVLLQKTGSSADPATAESRLLEARDAVELLKVYELRDYYRDECVDASRRGVTRLDEVSKNAVIIYPILLENRIELLVSLPTGLKRYSVAVSKEVLTREVRSFRAKLEKLTTREYLPHAQNLYRWLLGPIEEDLNGLAMESLVFVPDGPLRTVPMAALHDFKEFLIQKYALAITPGVNLTEPRPIPRENPSALAVGLTLPAQGFSPLPYVRQEIETVGSLYKGTRLLDEDFVLPRMVELLSNERFTILHIASHGVFGGDVRSSFLLSYDGKLTMDRLDEYVGLYKFRQNPLELLTLSACDTASGDDRAALGLAGLAVKAGARSALATLWHINDEASSSLVADFYSELRKPGISRARALQHAQLGLLQDPRYDHPGYWAPFLLINNWL